MPSARRTARCTRELECSLRRGMAEQSKRSRHERRKKKRTALPRGVLARYGTLDVIMIDVSEAGARIEHFIQLSVGRKSRFRFEWQDETLETEAEVRSCK